MAAAPLPRDPLVVLRDLQANQPVAPAAGAPAAEVDAYNAAVLAYVPQFVAAIQNAQQYTVDIIDAARRAVQAGEDASRLKDAALAQQAQAEAERRATVAQLDAVRADLRIERAYNARLVRMRDDERALIARLDVLRTEFASLQDTANAERNRASSELQRLRTQADAVRSRIDTDMEQYGRVQDVGQITRQLEDERRARAAAEAQVTQVFIEARAKVEGAELALATERAAGDVTRSEGYATLLRQRVLDGGSLDSPRHAQLVSDLAAARQRDIIRRFDAIGTALSAEVQKGSRDNNQVAALCNSMAGTLGGARLPGLPTTLIYRFETLEDAILFKDRTLITGARIDVQRGRPPNPAIVILDQWQK